MIETDEEKQALAEARSVATGGVDLMHKAAVAADDAVRAATRDLNKWAAEARAGKMRTGGLSAVDRLMLADTSGKAAPPSTTRSSPRATWSAPAGPWTGCRPPTGPGWTASWPAPGPRRRRRI
ncbi:hypothetical protein ACFQ3Z_20970 [Streptomyces nogalater]